jgi:hypothetical protein
MPGRSEAAQQFAVPPLKRLLRIAVEPFEKLATIAIFTFSA